MYTDHELFTLVPEIFNEINRLEPSEINNDRSFTQYAIFYHRCSDIKVRIDEYFGNLVCGDRTEDLVRMLGFLIVDLYNISEGRLRQRIYKIEGLINRLIQLINNKRKPLLEILFNRLTEVNCKLYKNPKTRDTEDFRYLLDQMERTDYGNRESLDDLHHELWAMRSRGGIVDEELMEIDCIIDEIVGAIE